MKPEILEFWMVKGISVLAKEIYNKTGDKKVRFDLRKIDFDHAFFQEEALYCAVREWISKYYEVPIPLVEVVFEEKQNKILFKIP